MSPTLNGSTVLRHFEYSWNTQRNVRFLPRTAKYIYIYIWSITVHTSKSSTCFSVAWRDTFATPYPPDCRERRVGDDESTWGLERLWYRKGKTKRNKIKANFVRPFIAKSTQHFSCPHNFSLLPFPTSSHTYKSHKITKSLLTFQVVQDQFSLIPGPIILGRGVKGDKMLITALLLNLLTCLQLGIK